MFDLLLIYLLAGGGCNKSVRIISAKQASRERRIRRQQWLGVQTVGGLFLLVVVLAHSPPGVFVLIFGIAGLYCLGTRRKVKAASPVPPPLPDQTIR